MFNIDLATSKGTLKSNTTIVSARVLEPLTPAEITGLEDERWTIETRPDGSVWVVNQFPDGFAAVGALFGNTMMCKLREEKKLTDL